MAEKKNSISVRCSICKTELTTSSPQFPFCSTECRERDLNSWLSAKYTIPVVEMDELDEDGTKIPEEPTEG